MPWEDIVRTLVTGGTGFTGSALAFRLLADGHEVHIVDNAKGLFYDELRKKGATIDLGTIADRAFCERAIGDAEIVHHFAAAFRRLNVPKKHYWDVNVEGTRYLIEAAQRAGVRRFVYCSTQGVHGHIDNPPGDETSPIAPEDYYQFTKYEGEKVVNEIAERAGIETVTIRPTAIYGPGDPARFLMLFRMCKTGTFHMLGSGLTTYHPVFIDNLVDACIAAQEQEGISGETYIIADEHYFTLNDLVGHVANAMGVQITIRHWPFWPVWVIAAVCEALCYPIRITPPLFRRRVDWFRQVRAFSIDKARRDLGYVPKVGIEEGLSRTAKWYKEHNYI